MPFLWVQGIAGNFAADTSQAFRGVGIVPSLYDRMSAWDQYGLKVTNVDTAPRLKDDDVSGGVIGYGMADRLDFCQELKLTDCQPRPPVQARAPVSAEAAEFSGLAREDFPEEGAAGRTARLDLLAATSGGAPNVVSLDVRRAMKMETKPSNDSLVYMHLKLAQQLVCGRGERKVTGLMLQLDRSDFMEAAVRRLRVLLPEKDYEVKTFEEVSPMYGQTISMFATIFGFVASIMGMIVIFTTVNTMSMSVMERTSEIGTLRALGLRRSRIAGQFVAEGFLLGVMGTTLGAAAALVIGALVNWAQLTWTPPDYALPILLSVHFFLRPMFLPCCWLGLVAMATLSSLLPARNAARMVIVDALRHN